MDGWMGWMDGNFVELYLQKSVDLPSIKSGIVLL